MAQAYSYIRFSSKKQELGDSLKRQLKLAEEYAARHGITLDTSTYRDLGVSAFKGKNAETGHLKTFLEAVDRGLIKKGSLLLVESLDRLSRSDVDEALELFLSIIRRGITIVTLADQQTFSTEKIKQDKGVSLIISIAGMVRANDESATKSKRLTAAWSTKREKGKHGEIMTTIAPSWLKPSDDRKRWIVDRKKAKAVERLYDLALAGHGTPTIARMLNEKGISNITDGGRWSYNSIHWLLRNPAVVGTWTTRKKGIEDIPGYYPAIISETKFALTQEALRKRRWIGGRSRENVANLFAGLSYCAECGNKMRVVSTDTKVGKATSEMRRSYIKCVSSYEGTGCTEGRFPYLPAERAILRYLADDLSELIASVDSDHEDPSAVLRIERDALTTKIENLLDQMENVKSPQLQQRVNNLQAGVDKIDAALAEAVSPKTSATAWSAAAALFETLKGRGAPIDHELRLQLQVAIRRIIKAVYFKVDEENRRPTVAIQFDERIREPVLYLDVRPFLDRVGTYRRPERSRPKRAADSNG
jgi:DNA invertase Pin-like site-specific DNA recombinase